MVGEDWRGEERVEEVAQTDSCSSGGGEKEGRSWRVVTERG